MERTRFVDRVNEAMVWGAIFVWWGVAVLLRLPNGMDALGIGLILLGLIAARSLTGLASSWFTITLGTVALVWGVLDLARSVLHLPLSLGAEYAILLIVVGVILVARGSVKTLTKD